MLVKLMVVTKWYVESVVIISVGHVWNRLKAINILQKTHYVVVFLKLKLMINYKWICSVIKPIKNIKYLDKKSINNIVKIVLYAQTANLSILKMIEKLMILSAKSVQPIIVLSATKYFKNLENKEKIICIILM